MMLRYSLNAPAAADQIEAAVGVVLDQGFRTDDIATSGDIVISTVAIGDAVVAALRS
jgi:3-isopropylmalate dehydrogenase